MGQSAEKEATGEKDREQRRQGISDSPFEVFDSRSDGGISS